MSPAAANGRLLPDQHPRYIASGRRCSLRLQHLAAVVHRLKPHFIVHYGIAGELRTAQHEHFAATSATMRLFGIMAYGCPAR